MATFRVEVSFDRESVRERTYSGRPIVCPIHLQIRERAFPHQRWDDFAIVILAWWAQELISLEQGYSRHAVLRFMEGPYEVHITPASDGLWCLTGVQRGSAKEIFREEFLGSDVRVEIIRASERILGAIERAGFWGEDCESLHAMIECKTRPGPEDEV